jgi:hypothetical protein
MVMPRILNDFRCEMIAVCGNSIVPVRQPFCDAIITGRATPREFQLLAGVQVSTPLYRPKKEECKVG